jgi:hypothetical protein
MIVTRKNAAPPLPSPCTACKGGQIWLHSLTQGGMGSQFFQIFLPETEAEILEIWNDPVERKTDTQKIIW